MRASLSLVSRCTSSLLPQSSASLSHMRSHDAVLGAMQCSPSSLQSSPRRQCLVVCLTTKRCPVPSIDLPAQGDVRKNQDCKRWVEETCARLGGLDILVNCAAGNFLVSVLLTAPALHPGPNSVYCFLTEQAPGLPGVRVK